jgi:hypothetical protein
MLRRATAPRISRIESSNASEGQGRPVSAHPDGEKAGSHTEGGVEDGDLGFSAAEEVDAFVAEGGEGGEAAG